MSGGVLATPEGLRHTAAFNTHRGWQCIKQEAAGSKSEITHRVHPSASQPPTHHEVVDGIQSSKTPAGVCVDWAAKLSFTLSSCSHNSRQKTQQNAGQQRFVMVGCNPISLVCDNRQARKSTNCMIRCHILRVLALLTVLTCVSDAVPTVCAIPAAALQCQP